MTKNVEGISLKKSKRVIDGKPNLPTPDKLVEGEIAINYAEGYETISTKNESGVITVFSSDDYYTKKKLGDDFTGENSAKTVTDAIGEVVDELEAHTASTSHMDATEKENLDSLAANIAAISGITAEKVERWDEGSISAHTHENKEYLDAISGYVGTMAYEEKTDYTTTAVTDALNTVVTAHTADTDVHVTTTDKTYWNDKVGYAEYDSTDEKIYFYKSNTETATSLCEIDASSFIVDGMVEDVELVTSGDTTALVITWNTDAGSKTITLDVGDIFEADNYYTKSETSGATEISTALAEKLAISDFNTYSAATDTLINSKASQSDLDTLSGTVTAHTADTDIHMNATEKENLDSLATNIAAISGITAAKITDWDDAVLSAHNHDNKAYLDTITGNVGTIAYENKESYSSATEVATALGTGFTVSSVTDVIREDERVTTAAFNDIYANKADLSALTEHTSDSVIHITAAERTAWNNASVSAHTHDNKAALDAITGNVGTMAYENAADYTLTSTTDALNTVVTAHTADTDIHITSAERTAWNDKVDFSDLVNYFDGAKYELSGSTHVINFYNDSTIKATIDATDFIKDGMIDTVELVQLSGDTYLRITWNTDAGKEVTDLNIGDIFDADNYYTKSETSAATEISTALGTKVNSATFISHTASTVHMNATEKENLDSLATNIAAISGITSTKVGNWDTAYSNNHTHSNKAALDAITGSVGTMAYEDKTSYSSATEVNAALAEKSDTSHTHASSAVTSMDGYAMAASGNPITTADTLNQAIGKLEKMIDEFKEYVSQKELVISAALNDLNDRMGGMTLVKLTQAEYDALTVKDPNTMYIINN